jgi:hypothetical protein
MECKKMNESKTKLMEIRESANRLKQGKESVAYPDPSRK